jgi:hypothetical protein
VHYLSSQGYLTLADLYTFFREVHGLWVAMGEYADLDIYDVLDEVRCLHLQCFLLVLIAGHMYACQVVVAMPRGQWCVGPMGGCG